MNLRTRAEVFIFKRNNVLCAYTPKYVCFPGGGVDKGETPKEAAQREAMEEAGRKVINCTVAHPPVVQHWTKEYRESVNKAKAWAAGKNYTGGYTYFMTGSSSDLPVPPAERHEDYEGNMDWHPVKHVIEKLKRELRGDWKEDVTARVKILETHLAMQKKQAAFKFVLPFEQRNLIYV
jgi:8-oxo-dGTP pyrophosphatase MutT (NUDIX family)